VPCDMDKLSSGVADLFMGKSKCHAIGMNLVNASPLHKFLYTLFLSQKRNCIIYFNIAVVFERLGLFLSI
ncbi:hypothetical protein, partial [Enterococcus faecalis]|uniref:hypothetical protein n=1 Tax=Enterococcus faecalis TaxID=1351 RepID=UPI003D6B3449